MKVSWLGRVVYPRALNASQSKQGQAALPNHEMLSLESSLCLMTISTTSNIP